MAHCSFCITQIYPPPLIVNESVLLAKKVTHSGIAGLVNAVLRKIEREDLRSSNDSLKNFPSWIADRWRGSFGEEEAQKLATALCTKPKLFFRANTLRVSPLELVSKLASEGIVAVPSEFVPECLEVRMGQVTDLTTIPSYREGLFSVQDLSESIVGRVVAPKASERILDMCAGPGGKTSHLAQLMGGKGQIVALDLHEKRAELVRKNLSRLGIASVEVVQADALTFEGDSFDCVLLDGPCSGSGVFNKKVDSKWKLLPADLLELGALQAALLKKAVELVKPGGRIVYSTCSVEPEENEYQISKVLSENENLRGGELPEFLAPLRSLSPHREFHLDCALTTYPHIHGCAGGFVASISRL